MKEVICAKCNVPLVTAKAVFKYLGHEVTSDVPKCPVCNQVYLSEELVYGKIAEVEKEFEDK